jgi:1-phosphofructokinase family hexose kinase
VTIVTVTLNTSLDRTVEVPRFTVGGHVKGTLLGIQAAGKGVNVSRCLGRLGVPSVVSGLVGARDADRFAESFAGGPATVALVPVDAPTRVNTTILDPAQGTETHVREAGFPVRAEAIEALRERLRRLASPDAVAVFCGSLPPGLTDEHLAGFIAACQESGARIAADLNGPQLAAAIDAEPVLIKPNVAELGELLGRDLSAAPEDSLVAAARTVCDRVETVLLTRGRDGALAVTADRALAAAVDVPEVRSTVGCGDAALAGFLAGLWHQRPLEDCLASAVACGAASAMAPAAGQIDTRHVDGLRARLSVRPVG